MTGHDIEKALEVWTLQNLLNFSILLGLVAFGLVLIQPYYRSLQEKLTLRVSLEIWTVTTTLLVDILLAFVVLVGYLVLNPDIMADIKIAVPFIPVTVLLFTVALLLRLFHGGHQLSNPNYTRSIWIMFAANLINMTGFTMVMEAPSGAYLARHPSVFWSYIKTHLRSNTDPYGLELSQLTFYICYPVLVLILLWGFRSALKYLHSVRER